MSELRAQSGNHFRDVAGRSPVDASLDPSSTLYNNTSVSPERERPVPVAIFFRHKHPRPVEMHQPRRTL